jgi:hypothetical protein
VYFVPVMLAYAGVIITSAVPPTFIAYLDWIYDGAIFND